jgi:hypothetical protein
MKTLINNRLVALSVAAIFALTLSVSAMANGDKKEATAELKYIGKYNNQPVFEISFNNQDAKEFVVTIVDESRNVLYKDVIAAGTISKKYALNTDELGNVPLQFEITSKKTNKTTVYQINKESRIVEDVVVSKL